MKKVIKFWILVIIFRKLLEIHEKRLCRPFEDEIGKCDVLEKAWEILRSI